jgi:putative membrane protein
MAAKSDSKPGDPKATVVADHHRAVKAQVKLAQSAGALKESAVEQTESADRRTVLAADRTVLAAERTYAAWVRTGLAALAAGVGARALLDKIMAEPLILATGSVLIVFGAFCFVAAVWRQMFGGPPPPIPDTRRIPPAVLVLVNGFLVLVSIVALIGVWDTRGGG